MAKRFNSVWDALPPGMRDSQPVDLLGDAIPTPARHNSRPEAAALTEVLMALRAHPGVSWCERQNTGTVRIGNRFVKFGWPGCSDIVGQLRDGRFLAVECKSTKGRLRPEQSVFLERINQAGGVAFVARNCLDVHRQLTNQRTAP